MYANQQKCNVQMFLHYIKLNYILFCFILFYFALHFTVFFTEELNDKQRTLDKTCFYGFG